MPVTEPAFRPDVNVSIATGNGRFSAVDQWPVLGVHRGPAGEQFPRLDVEWHEQGFVLQCFEDDRSSGNVLVDSPRLGSPTVEINLGGQALERWPLELFVSEQLAHQAVDHFLNSGKQDPALHWVRIDAFPRSTIWKDRAGREAWERTNRRTGDDV